MIIMTGAWPIVYAYSRLLFLHSSYSGLRTLKDILYKPNQSVGIWKPSMYPI